MLQSTRLKHPQCEDYTSHLLNQLLSLHREDVFHNTIIHLDDGNVTINRLLVGLLFPDVGVIDVFNVPEKVDLFVSDICVEGFQSTLCILLNNESDKLYSENRSCVDFGNPVTAVDFVKPEILESSPDIHVKLENNIFDSIDQKYKWPCYMCNQSFKRAEQLSFHAMEAHSTDRPYHCSFCEYTAREKSHLLRHERTHTRSNQISCQICDKKFLDSRDLNNHQTVHSNVRDMPCPHCQKMFKSELYLKRHVRLVHTSMLIGIFKCDTCDKSFKTKDYLNRHVRKIHKNPVLFVCSFCGKKFKSASHRKDHEEIHRGEGDAECELCGAQVRKRNMERHMKTHSETADYQCDICAKPLKTMEALRAHVNSHELPFKCEHCDKAFSTKYSMKSHTVQQHLLKQDDSQHQAKVRTKNKLIQCDICEFQCSTARYMKTHKAVKHEGLLHHCDDCSFSTGDLGSLRNHRKAKHEGVIYACNLCDFRSGYKNNLKNHKAVAHLTVDDSSNLKSSEEIGFNFNY